MLRKMLFSQKKDVNFADARVIARRNFFWTRKYKISMSFLLSKKAIPVDIPIYLRIRVRNNTKKICKLSYTPPIPWVQNNDWQVCCDDFMQYIGEWTKEDFIRESNDGNGIEYFKSLLNDDFIKQINDINVLFNDLGKNTVAFVFLYRICNKKKVVCQSF